MTAAQLAIIIDQLVQNADNRYNLLIGRVQRNLYSKLVEVLSDLDLDVDGYIKQSSVNRKLLLEADRAIFNVFNKPLYNNAVSAYVLTVPRIDVQNIEYFLGIDPLFQVNKRLLRTLQEGTVTAIERYVLQDGLQSQVVDPLNLIINQNVNSGGKFSGFLKQLETYVVGNPDVEGRLMSYTRTYLRDTLFTYARTFQEAATTDLGLEFYLYSGGLIDTSRAFCEERAGQYFHKSEIEAWAELEWKGKKNGTTESSIFMFLGGWNCGHQLIPVSELIVPQDVIDRIRV